MIYIVDNFLISKWVWKNNDKTFGTKCLDTLRPGDLCIRDLGYFSLEDLDQNGSTGTYFISRLKLNTNVYIKNPNPAFFHNGTIKKQTEYIKINLQMMIERLLPGETYEVGNVYVGITRFCLRDSFCIV